MGGGGGGGGDGDLEDRMCEDSKDDETISRQESKPLVAICRQNDSTAAKTSRNLGNGKVTTVHRC